jgi:hypothetical protein
MRAIDISLRRSDEHRNLTIAALKRAQKRLFRPYYGKAKKGNAPHGIKQCRATRFSYHLQLLARATEVKHTALIAANATIFKPMEIFLEKFQLNIYAPMNSHFDKRTLEIPLTPGIICPT